MIIFEQVCKTYRVEGRDITALHPFDLSIAQSEIFGIIGHSGAGKSTLLRLINLLERPSAGVIKVEGMAMNTLAEPELRRQRRRIGMIFQHFNLLASQTVRENVALPLRLAGERNPVARQKRVDALLERVGLSAHRDKYPHQLSGGQKQRVGIARALANHPSILLCDEATSALDPQTTASVLKLLAELNRELNLTIVLITHEMDVIRRVCDRVVVLDAGHMIEHGTVADVFLHPKHTTTRHFVAEALPEEASAYTPYHQVPGRLFRLSFRGEATWNPILNQVARDTQVDFNILSGRIDRIKDLPYGQLTLAMQGSGMDAAIARLRQADIDIEEIIRCI